MKFHISRWRYWWGYAAVFLLAMLAIWLTDRASDLMSYLAGGAAIIVLLIFEFLIRREQVRFSETGIDILRGKKMTRVSYDSISDASVIQTVFQSVMRFGDVLIKKPGEEIVLKNFAEPGRIAKAVGTRIHVSHELHEHHKGGPGV